MAEFKYQFKTVDDKEKISGSKIFNIIDGFPSDYSEQTVLIYGKLKTLFGEPLYEEKDVENQYTYGLVTTGSDGREIFLHVYSGPSGPAIGGQQDEESREAAHQLAEEYHGSFKSCEAEIYCNRNRRIYQRWQRIY